MPVPINTFTLQDINTELGSNFDNIEDLFTSAMVYEGGLNISYCNNLVDLRTKPYNISKWRGYTAPTHNMSHPLFIQRMPFLTARYNVFSYNPSNNNTYPFNIEINPNLVQQGFNLRISITNGTYDSGDLTLGVRLIHLNMGTGINKYVVTRRFKPSPFNIHIDSTHNSNIASTISDNILAITSSGEFTSSVYIAQNDNSLIRKWNISGGLAFITGNTINLGHSSFRVKGNILVDYTNQLLYTTFYRYDQGTEYYISKFSLNTGLVISTIDISNLIINNFNIIGIYRDANTNNINLVLGHDSDINPNTEFKIYEVSNIFTSVSYSKSIYSPNILTNHANLTRIAQAPF